MVYKGHIKNGLVALEGNPVLPEGAEVTVKVGGEVDEVGADVRRLRETLLGVAGQVTGLPADLARNHDHYIHGSPKR